MSALLQELLNLGLVEIDDSDERFIHLDKAASTMADALRASPGDAIPHLLVAIDHTTLDDDPVFERAERAVMEQWKLLRRRYTERPRTLLRIVTFDALDRAAADSEQVRMGATFTAAPLLDHVELGREAAVFRRVIKTWASSVEETATKDWTSALKLPPKPVTKASPPGALEAPTFVPAQFRPSIEKAPGPNNPQNAISGANPHWPNQNALWAQEFSSRMTDAFVEAANLISEQVLKATSKAVSDSAKQWSATVASPVAAFALNVAEAMEVSQSAALLRLDLLWWKEALYSPSARVSYRTLPPAEAGLLMAHDVLSRISVPAPQSVVAFLRETAIILGGSSRRSIVDWLSELSAGSAANSIISSPPDRRGRIPLSDLLRRSVHARIPIEEVQARAGLNPSLQLSLADLVAWFFYDQQAELAVREGAGDQ